MKKTCNNCMYLHDYGGIEPCFSCNKWTYSKWKEQTKSEEPTPEKKSCSKMNVFDLCYALFAIKHYLPHDYTTYTIGQKTDLLQEIANILNGTWYPSMEDDAQNKFVLVADLKTGKVEAWEADLEAVDNTILFSYEASEKAKTIIPFDFIRSFQC